MRNQTSPPQPIANAQRYYKLGGWLMFIFVYGIVCALYSVLTFVQTINSLGMTLSQWSHTNLPQWIHVPGLVLHILTATASILFLIYLLIRHQKAFKITFLGYWILGTLAYLMPLLAWLFNTALPISGRFVSRFLGRFILPILYEIGYKIGYSPSQISVISAIPTIVMVVLYIALTVVWAVYLHRSKRVAVYFEPAGHLPGADTIPQSRVPYVEVPQANNPYYMSQSGTPYPAAPSQPMANAPSPTPPYMPAPPYPSTPQSSFPDNHTPAQQS